MPSSFLADISTQLVVLKRVGDRVFHVVFFIADILFMRGKLTRLFFNSLKFQVAQLQQSTV